MKFLKKYNEAVSSLHNLSDSDLNERLEYLVLEREDIQEEILIINKIIRYRQEFSEENYADSLPKSIFDFNKEQLDWIFFHFHGITTSRYNIAKRYFQQLTGVFANGFTKETKQFSFTIRSTRHDDDNFVINNDLVKSIKLLGDNLNKVESEYVPFGVYFSNYDSYDVKVKYVSDKDVTLLDGRYDVREMNSIENLLKAIFEKDEDL